MYLVVMSYFALSGQLNIVWRD